MIWLRRVSVALSLFASLMTGPALAQCRQALALGLDVSGSVDRDEYRLQLDGLAAALIQPDVRRALLVPSVAPVFLAVFEWSGSRHQRMLIDWNALTDRDTLFHVAEQLANTVRVPAPRETALGSAMLFGANLLTAGPDCWTRTLDLSGDGKSNVGPHPRDAHSVLSLRQLTLNALVIGADAPAIGDTRQVEIAELSAYFSAWVITGPDAFVETALGFEDYQMAMARKLLRELDTLAVSSLWGMPNAHPDIMERSSPAPCCTDQ